jgi:hypothetical protein
MPGKSMVRLGSRITRIRQENSTIFSMTIKIFNTIANTLKTKIRKLKI